MPFVSESQRMKFHSTPALKKYVPEFEAATGNAHLPLKVGTKPYPHKRRAKKHRHTALGALLAHTRSVHK